MDNIAEFVSQKMEEMRLAREEEKRKEVEKLAAMTPAERNEYLNQKFDNMSNEEVKTMLNRILEPDPELDTFDSLDLPSTPDEKVPVDSPDISEPDMDDNIR